MVFENRLESNIRWALYCWGPGGASASGGERQYHGNSLAGVSAQEAAGLDNELMSVAVIKVVQQLSAENSRLMALGNEERAAVQAVQQQAQVALQFRGDCGTSSGFPHFGLHEECTPKRLGSVALLKRVCLAARLRS